MLYQVYFDPALDQVNPVLLSSHGSNDAMYENKNKNKATLSEQFLDGNSPFHCQFTQLPVLRSIHHPCANTLPTALATFAGWPLSTHKLGFEPLCGAQPLPRHPVRGMWFP